MDGACLIHFGLELLWVDRIDDRWRRGLSHELAIAIGEPFTLRLLGHSLLYLRQSSA